MTTTEETMTSRRRRRIATVALAPVAALTAWGLIQLVGIELTVSVGDGTVGPADVLEAALLAASAGWLVARLLERYSRHPRQRWLFVGSTALAVSIIGPMHVAVEQAVWPSSCCTSSSPSW
jgi:hypothetical protein